MIKVVVRVDIVSNPWRVIDPEFDECPDSPVYYEQIYARDPVEIIEECAEVVIINSQTGVEGRGYPVLIDE